jgi:hypothetical protein
VQIGASEDFAILADVIEMENASKFRRRATRRVAREKHDE